ncbi:hypothetical protein H312_01173, partial [Anncaliia algerae PRA339]
NSQEIPLVGLGTFSIEGYDMVKASINDAVRIGYRHIDTAYCYDNEEDIGKAMQEIISTGPLKREDFFITTKFWNTQRDPLEGLKDSLKKLQMDYVDLYLIHFPVMFSLKGGKPYMNKDGHLQPEKLDLKYLWGRMEDIYKLGLAKSIGISNFGPKRIQELLSFCNIVPAVNQIEMHPYFQQREIRKICEKNNIKIVAFSSFGGTRYLRYDSPVIKDDPIINSIALKYSVSSCNVILSWIVSKGACIIPKSTNYDHMKENFYTISLSEEEIQMIDNISINYRYNDPPTMSKDVYE